MKKLLALLLAMIVVLSLAACGEETSYDNDDDDDDDDDDDKTTQTQKAEGTGDGTGTADGGVVTFPGFDTPDVTLPAEKDTQRPITTQRPDVAVTEEPEVETESEDPILTPTYAYTKGTVSNGKYTNNWAGFGYSFDGSWVDNTVAGNQSVGGTTTEMGLMLQNAQSGQVLQIMFEKLPALQANMTEQEYANILKAQLETTYSQIGYTIAEFNTSTRVIAGETYTVLGVRFSNPQMVQVMCLRNLDGYMITVCASALNDAGASSILSGITVA